MTRYVCGFFLVLFLLFSFGLCLSSNQNSTMIAISNLINNPASPWNAASQPDPCSWKGVHCSPDNSSVTNLSLSGFGVSNSGVLSEVCKIESWQSLDLSNNHFSSISVEFINGCGVIDGLKTLSFSRNRLTGALPNFNGFAGLESLDLSFNFLSGNIDSQFKGLLGLKSLNLSFNRFTSSVPVNLGNSTALEELQLSGNLFQGEIPSQIMSYRNLTRIDLSTNNLSGSIPLSIGNLVRLQYLILSNNKLTGEIPPQIMSHRNLTRIDLSVNNLHGSIPLSIGNLVRLQYLILSDNNLAGEIPPAIGNITTLIRFAANQNGFGGKIPSGITRHLRLLDLSYNNLTGSLPSDLLSQPNLQTVDLSYNSFDGQIPENISPSLVRLRLGSNSFTGSVPSLFTLTQKLTYLELDNNTLTGGIPPGLGYCKTLSLLNLAQNNLTGTLPEHLGNITNLEVLKLQINRFSGEIPISLTQLPKLSTLNISWNALNGLIPHSISNLQNSLSHLNLQGNDLSGVIPDGIRSMTFLLELQLGQNQLGGRIPSMPEKLQIALNLSSNLFHGPIPNTLSSLKDLEILDLSNNNFSGEIPAFLTQLGSLTELILSNNRLTGVIPSFPSWVALNTSGNAGLINATRSPPQVTNKKKSPDMAVILAVVAAVITASAFTIALFLSLRRFPKVTDQQSQSTEDLPPPQVIQGNLLTANAIHRSNIDLTKAVEAVAHPWNIVLKTRFSTYFKATMPSGASYFVKKINWSDKIFKSGSHDKFDQELEALGKLTNSNVMTPLAYVLTDESAYLLYEHAQKGTLFDVLHGKLKHALDWSSRYSIAVGVAQGLTFLHGYSSGPILLLDLSSKNIFLKSLKEPLVGDIELYKIIDPSKSTGSLSTVAGSVGYIPPEYAYTMRVTMAGNVYSFGVILLELLTGKPAVSEGTELAKWVLSNSLQQDRWDHILDFNISKTSPAARGQMLAILKTAICCVSVSPEARPKMKSVLRMILNAR